VLPKNSSVKLEPHSLYNSPAKEMMKKVVSVKENREIKPKDKDLSALDKRRAGGKALV